MTTSGAIDAPSAVSITDLPATTLAPIRKRGRPLGSKNKPTTKKPNGTYYLIIVFHFLVSFAPMAISNSHQVFDNSITQNNSSTSSIINPDSTLDIDQHPAIPTDNVSHLSTPFNFQFENANMELILTHNRDPFELTKSYCFQTAIDLFDGPDPKTIKEARSRSDWPLWKPAIASELKSLQSRSVFTDVLELPPGKTCIGYRWVLTRKRNDKGVVTRYNARLVAQGFTQVLGLDFQHTYSPVMDSTTFRFLVAFATHQSLTMKMMDVVTAYLYGHLDEEIYMKVPDGLAGEDISSFRIPCVRVTRSLYGLKQAGRMWFHRLATYLIANGFINSTICPCIFIRRIGSDLCIIAVYVDDLNLIGTPTAVSHASIILDNEFEMKDLGPTSLCIGIQLSQVPGGVLMHQSLYTKKILAQFNMTDCHPVSTPMVVRSLEVNLDQFAPCREGETLLSQDTPYLSAIGALMYLANTTRPDITFPVNLLARYSNSATQRHWKGVQQILRYLSGTIDMGLFYRSSTTPITSDILTGYADAGYLSDPHTGRSQTGYVFMYNGTAISWRSTKQTLTATSSNHSEIMALHEASRECIWLRSLINHIQGVSGYPKLDQPTTLFEDNAACIEQIKSGFIKGDRTKHIAPKFFFTSELQGIDINVTRVNSCDNISDIFTKSLGRNKHEHFVNLLGLRKLSDLLK